MFETILWNAFFDFLNMCLCLGSIVALRCDNWGEEAEDRLKNLRCNQAEGQAQGSKTFTAQLQTVSAWGLR